VRNRYSKDELARLLERPEVVRALGKTVVEEQRERLS
jgi:hypothetical protein